MISVPNNGLLQNKAFHLYQLVWASRKRKGLLCKTHVYPMNGKIYILCMCIDHTPKIERNIKSSISKHVLTLKVWMKKYIRDIRRSPQSDLLEGEYSKEWWPTQL